MAGKLNHLNPAKEFISNILNSPNARPRVSIPIVMPYHELKSRQPIIRYGSQFISWLFERSS